MLNYSEVFAKKPFVKGLSVQSFFDGGWNDQDDVCKVSFLGFQNTDFYNIKDRP